MLDRRARESARRRIRRKDRINSKDVVATVGMNHTARIVVVIAGSVDVAVVRISLRKAPVWGARVLNVTALHAIIAAGAPDDDFSNRQGVVSTVGNRRHIATLEI